MSKNDTHITITGIEGVSNWLLMSEKALYGATKHGVFLAAKSIYETTLGNISSAPFKSDNLSKGVKFYFDNVNNAGTVDILGTNAYKESWHLRFFEVGTKTRVPKKKTKDGRDRKKPYGHITGSWFFKNAIMSSESRAYEIVKNTINQKIAELNNG